MASTAHHAHTDRPLLGLRTKPGRLALWVFGIPLVLYRHGWGRFLGHTFLQLVHVGRRTGRQHQAVAMVLAWDPVTRAATICSGWGPDADWVRNLRAGPAARVDVGRDSFVPAHRFLTDEGPSASSGSSGRSIRDGRGSSASSSGGTSTPTRRSPGSWRTARSSS